MKFLNKKYKGSTRGILSVMAIILLVATGLILPFLAVKIGIILATVITPSVNIGDMRKSAGSVTYSHNHFGLYMRLRKKPINPKSSFQTHARNLVKGFSQAFKGIGQPSILAWNNYGKTHAVRGKSGGSQTLTGEEWYIKTNCILANAGIGAITNPPSPSAVAPVAPVSFLGIGTTLAGALATLTLSFAPVIGAAQTLFVSASPVLSGGKTYNSDKRLIAAKDSTFLTGASILTDFTNRLGAAASAGAVIFVYGELVDNTTGLVSQRISSRVVLT